MKVAIQLVSLTGHNSLWQCRFLNRRPMFVAISILFLFGWAWCLSGLERWTGDQVVLGSNPITATSLQNFCNSVYPALP